MRFMLASGNSHKLTEFRQILAPHEVLAMPGDVELPPEGESCFVENARSKAYGLARAMAACGGAPEAGLPEAGAAGLLYLADDSGLEVEALEWAPGVTSARYAGVDGPGADIANVARLLRELADYVGPGARRARFVCSLVAVDAEFHEYAVTGHWWGAIAESPRGAGGFGYDPVFIPDGSELTVAEWSQPEKDRASHRALAGVALLDCLRREGLIGGGAPG